MGILASVFIDNPLQSIRRQNNREKEPFPEKLFYKFVLSHNKVGRPMYRTRKKERKKERKK
jgi:hypothetical protein